MQKSLWETESASTAHATTPAVHAVASSTIPSAAPPQTARATLNKRFAGRIQHNPALDRSLVSFQANKGVAFSGWFKYREGYSESLVAYLLRQLHPRPGRLLDPFAGGGSSLFAASDLGWDADGIEVLPVGIYAMRARMMAARVDAAAFKDAATIARDIDFEHYYDDRFAFQHIAITRAAYPPVEERQLTGYRAYCRHQITDTNIRTLMEYAAFCVLEDISYTRKDGQYLRWDARSGRSAGKRPFNKGRIVPFREALSAKLRQMSDDLDAGIVQGSLFDGTNRRSLATRRLAIHEGSCLHLLPTFEPDAFDFVLTSPPYANRYDYTRTYALELVFLGRDADEVKRLRQAMLSCTVENRDKRAQLEQYYSELGRPADFQMIDATFQRQAALHEVLDILDRYRAAGTLNNDNIARLVRNYFYEMCCVIHGFARVLRPGGIVAMVNDNVRYAGEEVPVDLILSDFAESFGLTVRHIWTLGRGKGNSSQQMGSHGRTELRKCVYVWEKR